MSPTVVRQHPAEMGGLAHGRQVASRRRDHGLGRCHPRHAPRRVGRGGRGDPARRRVRRGRPDRRARRAAGDRTGAARTGRGPRPGGDDRRHRVRAARRDARGDEGRHRTRGSRLGRADARRRAGADADGSAQPRGRRERRYHADRQPPGEPERRSGEPDGSHGCPAACRGPAGGIDGRAPDGPRDRRSDDVGSFGDPGDGDDHRGQTGRCTSLPGRGADRDRSGRPARGHARVRGVRRCRGAGWPRRAGRRSGRPAHRDVPSRSRGHRGVRRAPSVAADARDRVRDAGRRGAPSSGARPWDTERRSWSPGPSG